MNDDVSDLLVPKDWTFPVPIAYGPGRLSEIGSRCKDMHLRNPLIVHDVGDHFTGSGFGLFAGMVEKGMKVRAIAAPKTAEGN